MVDGDGRDGSRRVLVVGMGVSGIAAAARLRRSGWTPVVVEKASARRSGGYVVALFGAGRTAAQRLGLSEHLHNRVSAVDSLDLDRAGHRRPGMSFSDIAAREDGPWIVLRGDVERAAAQTLPEDVEVRYSTTPTAIAQDGAGVEVTLRDTAAGVETTERFDLVIGADGLRSTVRRLAFGPDSDYLHRLNYMIAAYVMPRTPAGLSAGQGATLMEPGRGLTIFAFADHEPVALMSYKTDNVDAEFTAPAVERLRAAWGPQPRGAVLDEVIEQFDAAGEKLFDSAEQVHMARWSHGRVVLLGDSAWCVTLYAGMGVSAGLAGAEVLGLALDNHPDDIQAALAQWEATLRPFITEYQDSSGMGRMIFVPDSRAQVLGRRLMSWLGQFPLGKRLTGRLMPDFGPKNADVAASMSLAAATMRPHEDVVLR